MPKASNLKKGNIVSIDNKPFHVKHIDIHAPTARGANTLYRIRLASLVTGQKLDKTFKGNDILEEITVDKRKTSYLFRAQDMHTFMDSENFEQYTISSDTLEGQLPWLEEGMEGVMVLLQDGLPLCIEIPLTIDLEIVNTAPSIKGASATNRNKPAELSNGITVMVPEYMAPGEVVRVNTETGQYMSRVKI